MGYQTKSSLLIDILFNRAAGRILTHMASQGQLTLVVRLTKSINMPNLSRPPIPRLIEEPGSQIKQARKTQAKI